MRTFNVGILGCGVISRTYVSDIQAFYPRLKIVACADVSLALAEKLAREFDIPKACLTEELLADEAVEIVVNLTPPQLHVALDKQIIAAGKHLPEFGAALLAVLIPLHRVVMYGSFQHGVDLRRCPERLHLCAECFIIQRHGDFHAGIAHRLEDIAKPHRLRSRIGHFFDPVNQTDARSAVPDMHSGFIGLLHKQFPLFS